MTFIRFRFILIILFLALGLLLHVQLGWGAAWYLYAAALVLLLTQVLFGGVFQAFRLLQLGNPAGAEKLLNSVWSPSLLLPRHQAHYYFCWGLIALQRKKLDEGIRDLEKAVAKPRLRPSAQGLAKLNLAHAYFLKEDHHAVKKILPQIEALNLNDLRIKDGIRDLKAALAKKS
jgi:tetratricopeptide (TPR) repeat protein